MYFYGPENFDLAAIRNKLEKINGLSLIRELPLHQDFLDTFDWRLFNAQGYMIREQHGQENRYLWRHLTDDGLQGSITLHREAPAFAWDFPASPIQKRLAKILAMRRLLPVLKLTTQRLEYYALDSEEKKTATLYLDQNQITCPNGAADTVSEWSLQLLPVKGYEKEAGKIARRLQQIGFGRRKHPYLHETLQRFGVTPGTYSSKLNIKLDSSAPAAKATTAILKTLFATMQENEAGTIADLDSEFLHDYRVAVRRTRSALSQIKGVFGEAETNRWKEQFAWLGQITGPTRDLDVYLLKFENYRGLLPEEYRGSLEDLKKFLVQKQAAEQKTLARTLGTAKYKKLLDDYRAFLEDDDKGAAPNADLAIRELASRRIWKTFQRIVQEGKAITDESPAEDLHELRKTGKKLRYLMEFFQSLYPPGEVKNLIAGLKLLQENLGDFQDYEVQAQSITGFSEEMQQKNMGNAQTFMAMGILASHLIEGQMAARREFADRFTSFDSPEAEQKFRQLFGPRKKKSAKGKSPS
ncbi:CHAD domain-containing protein [Emcibacter nanhaiensis]|uniref:CHAD domain-containing protein n=1 Tax=Emcibacter nanhaiensis TaxID=1505037 RepID=A0A501PN08_9PROT|nr:CHAD domain-containing protein [Emcibacter nanhaiensis]TPD61829.1 CHAD domain-containing protein [Emcibacter nanhaiensis]